MSNDERPHHILLVEDEQHLAVGLKLNFELEGHVVTLAATARQAHQSLSQTQFDVVVLDVMLPDSDGFTICRQMREQNNFTPVLMLTARGRPEDRIAGLEAGADDYLPKPFELDELLARIRSLLRRQAWQKRSPADACYRFGRAVIDFERFEATVDGNPIVTTSLELSLLRYFVENPQRVISRAELLEKVWNLQNYPNTRTVDNFVMRLRRHFEEDPARPVFFRSVRGAGYKFLPTGQ